VKLLQENDRERERERERERDLGEQRNICLDREGIRTKMLELRRLGNEC
jgi:hypothetical protein